MCAVSNEEIQKALEAYNYFTSNPEAMQVIENRLKCERDRQAEIAFARNEGREEGREEGGFNKALAIARRMLKKAMPFSEISEITGLSVEEIKALQK